MDWNVAAACGGRAESAPKGASFDLTNGLFQLLKNHDKDQENQRFDRSYRQNHKRSHESADILPDFSSLQAMPAPKP